LEKGALNLKALDWIFGGTFFPGGKRGLKKLGLILIRGFKQGRIS